MKIVFLSFYSGFVSRGMETVVDELASRLALKNQVTVYQTGPVLKSSKYETKQIELKNTWPKDKSNSFLRKLFLDYYSRLIAIFSCRALNQLVKQKPDIVFVCNGGWQTLLAKLYGFRHGFKLVTSGQAGLGWDDRWNLYLQSDLFVAISKRNYTWAKKQAPKTNLVYIPNGVDTKKFTPKGETIELPLTKPIILCVAGNQEYKRAKETIDAVEKLAKGSLLLVTGSKDASSEIKTYGERKLGNRFLCSNFKHDQMPAVYRSCNLFTLVSESSEAFGIAYIEAMASGIGIVATDDQLRHEIIGSAGLFCSNPGNSQDYALLLEKALSQKWTDIGVLTAQKYDWDKIAKQYEQQFEKLLK